MTDPAQDLDRPLVTFALFAYNQEKYIRAAVEGAFSQTYAPLEIILSDDCSSDRTFEIMQEMAAAYEGPHNVQLRQNQENLGLIQHVNTVMSVSLGVYVVIAAGDDISMPERVEELSKAMGKNVMLIHSDYTLIDTQGISLDQNVLAPRFTKKDLLVLAGSRSIYVGATGAWSREIYEKFGPIRKTSSYEDLVMGFRAALLGEIRFLNRKLVKYRMGSGITTGGIVGRRKRIATCVANIASLEQRKIDTQLALPQRYDIKAEIEKFINIERMRHALLTFDFWDVFLRVKNADARRYIFSKIQAAIKK